MIKRQVLGKIEFKVRNTLQRETDRLPGSVTLAGRDAVLAGDLKQANPIGDDPLYKAGDYTGKGQNKPKGSDGNPPGAKRYKKNSCAWARRLETLFKTESFSGKCMV